MQCTCTGTNTGLAGCGMRVKVEAGCGMQIPWQVQDFLILTGGMCDSFKIEVGCKTDNHGLQTLICENIPSGAGWLDLARNSGRMLNLKSLLDPQCRFRKREPAIFIKQLSDRYDVHQLFVPVYVSVCAFI